MSTPEQRASPAQARSIAALFLAAGAQPDEIDGAVETLIKMTAKSSLPPVSYAQVAQQAVDAVREYRRKTSSAVVDEASASYPVEHDNSNEGSDINI